MKTCRQCGEILEVGVNWPPSWAKNNDYLCKFCHNRAYMGRNRERKNAYMRAWRETHWEEENTRRKIYVEKHREEVNTWNRAYQKAHREVLNERRRGHRANSPKAKEGIRRAVRRHKIAKRGAILHGTHTVGEWLKSIALVGNRCLVCEKAFTDDNPATCDHIVSLAKGGEDSICNVQPLCRACNSRKGTKIIDYRSSLARAWAFLESIPWRSDYL